VKTEEGTATDAVAMSGCVTAGPWAPDDGPSDFAGGASLRVDFFYSALSAVSFEPILLLYTHAKGCAVYGLVKMKKGKVLPN